ncbi:MAG: sialate O-acetylesterase [Mariniblastus sp.]
MTSKLKFTVWIFIISIGLAVSDSEKVVACQFELKTPLTVLNYNVWNSFNHNKAYAETIRWVNRVEPDIAAWQELVGWDEQKLTDSAADWNHPYAAALKNGGYNIGLTSKFPIKVIERRTEKYHHGFLHCQTAGIDVIVCHLWPGKRREQIQEAAQIRDLVIELEKEGHEVLLMGDFNAHATSDAQWLNQQTELIKRRLEGDEKKEHKDRFIRDGKYTFDVMDVILEAPIIDLVRAEFDRTRNAKSSALARLGSFPSRILDHASTPKLQNSFLERIDFVFATEGLSKQCNSASIRRDDVLNRFSDHYPLVAKFGMKQTDVYLLAGQSNMQGIGKIAKLEEKHRGEIPRVQFFTDRQFEDLTVGETKTSTRKNEFGPEVGFGWQLSNTSVPTSDKADSTEISIVKFHASGQPLHHGWNRNKWEGDNFAPRRLNFYPGENSDDPNKGAHYQAMHKLFTKALADLDRQTINYRLAGFVWMQGEQDSKHAISADAYAQSLRRLKQRIEEDFNHGKPIPMVFGQVLPHTPALPRFNARDMIRKRMAQSDQDSGHANAIEGCKMISTDDFPLLPDSVHYNADGQWMMGTEFAKQLLLLNRN